MDHSQYLDLDPVQLPEGTIFRLPAGRCLIAQPSMFDDGTWIVLEYAIGETPHALTRGGFPGQDAAVSYAHVAHALRTVELGADELRSESCGCSCRECLNGNHGDCYVRPH